VTKKTLARLRLFLSQQGFRPFTLAQVLSAESMPAGPASPIRIWGFYRAIRARADLGTPLQMKRHDQFAAAFETLSLRHTHLYRITRAWV